MLFMYLELMGKSLSLFWDDLEAIRDNSTKNLKFYLIRVQWLFLHSVTIFTFGDHFCIQRLVTISCLASSDHFESSDKFLSLVTILSPMINFESSDHF